MKLRSVRPRDLAGVDAALAGRIEVEADGFEITFWAASKAEIEALHRHLDNFARATFLRPITG